MILLALLIDQHIDADVRSSVVEIYCVVEIDMWWRSSLFACVNLEGLLMSVNKASIVPGLTRV